MQGWPRERPRDLGGARHMELKSEQMPPDASSTGHTLCQSLLVARGGGREGRLGSGAGARLEGL